MVNVHVDGTFVACPSIDRGKAVFEDYVNSIMEWFDKDYIQFYITDHSIDTLFLAEKYPFWHDLKKSLNAFSINYIQDKDLNLLVESIIKKSNRIKIELGLTDTLFGKSTFKPSNLFPNRQGAFKVDLENTLCLLGLLLTVKKEFAKLHYILARDINNKKDFVFVNSTLDLYEPLTVFKECPITINTQLCIIDGYNSLMNVIDPIVLLLANTLPHNRIKLAISINTFKVGIENGCITSMHDIMPWTIGSDFINTLNDNGFLHEYGKAKAFLQCSSEALLNINLRKTHPLRTGPGGDDPQITRGNFRAYRRDINYEYHLHYWKDGDMIEIASVVVHNDMSIS